jgi:hypothetical protein
MISIVAITAPVALTACTGLLSSSGTGGPGPVPGDGGGGPVDPRDGGPPVEWDAGPPPPPGEPTYDLGAAPAEVTVAWPAAPSIARDVSATTLAEVNAAASMPGTRVRVSGAIDGLIEIRASDVEVLLEPGASASGVWIANQLARVTLRGGRLGYVEVQLPGTFYPAEEWHREWMTTDLLIDRVEVDAADTAFLIRSGRRVAITNSRAHAVRYGIWFGDSHDFESEDVIIAGNTITCDAPEATVRLVHVIRSATIGNRLANGEKHNYRIHGRSDLNWAARNVLIETGIMLGHLPGDTVGRQYFDDNTFYQRAPSMFEVDVTIPMIAAHRNRAYTDVWDCFWCVGAPPSGWVLEENVTMPYEPPPAL